MWVGSSIPVWVQCTPHSSLLLHSAHPFLYLRALLPPLFQPLHPSRGSCTPLRIVEPLLLSLSCRRSRRGREGGGGGEAFSSLFFPVSLPLYKTPPLPPSTSSSRPTSPTNRMERGRGCSGKMFSARREGEKGGRVADGQGREMIAWLRGWTKCARFCPSLVSAEVEGKVKRGFENENKNTTN